MKPVLCEKCKEEIYIYIFKNAFLIFLSVSIHETENVFGDAFIIKKIRERGAVR